MSTRKRTTQNDEAGAEETPRADWRLGAELPWLAAARARLSGAQAAGRLPHAILLKGPAGIGKAALAEWLARAVLCDVPASAPCGTCASCLLHAAGNHPDLRHVEPEPGKKQISVEAVRALIQDLALTGYRGGRRVGIVAPADALNVAGANAFLKTLEEPGPGTLLLLVASRTDRLPATIVSRCQQVAIPGPGRAAALHWLAGRGEEDWAGLLSLVGEAPLAALALAGAGAGGVPADMAALAAALGRGPVDLVAAAEVCSKEHPELRLSWIERWAMSLAYAASGSALPGAPAPGPLPRAGDRRHIEDLFRLIDATRRARGLLSGSVNAHLLFEGVLREFAATVRAASP